MSADRSPWRYAAACVRGRSHVIHDTPCQDRLLVRRVVDASGDDVLLTVVSDGAGSAWNAEAGAEAVVLHVADGAEKALSTRGLADLERRDVERWIGAARAGVASATQPIWSFAATVLVAIVGRERALYAQIGDGAIAVRDDEGSWSLATSPQHGPEASSTRFFTDEDWSEALEVVTSPSRRVLAVMSDGVETLAIRMADLVVHRPTVDALMRPVLSSDAAGEDEALSAGLAAWLDTPAVLSKTHDDKSLVLAARGAA